MIKKRNKNMPIIHRLIFSYIAIVLLTVLIVGSISLHHISKLMKQNLDNHYQALLSDCASRVDTQFENFARLSIELSNTSLMKMMMIQNSIENEAYNIMKFQELLSSYKIANSFIDEILITLNGRDIVIASNFQSNTDSFFRNAFSITSDSKILMNSIKSPSQNLIIPNITVDIFSSNHEGLLFVNTLPLNRSDDLRGSIVFFIKQDSIRNLTRHVLGDANLLLNVYNKNGQIIYQDGNNDIRNSSSIHKFHLKGNHEYVLYIPNSLYSSPIKEFLVISMSLAITIALLLCLLSFFLAKRNITPLNTFLLHLHELFSSSSPSENLISLEKNIENHVLREKEMKNTITNERPKLVNAFFLNLLNGYAAKEISTLMKFLNLDLPHKYFILILTDDEFVLEFLNKESKDYISYNIQIDEPKPTITICNCKNPQYLICNIKPKKHPVYISEEVTTIHDISLAYVHTLAIYDQHCFASSPDIFSYEKTYKSSSNYVYSIEDENQLMLNMLEGDLEKACKNYNEILNINKPECRYLLLMHIALTINRTAKKIDQTKFPYIDVKAIFSMDTTSSINQYINNTIIKLCNHVNSIKDNSKDQLKEAFLFIDNNFTMQDISLDYICSKFQINSSFFSRQFKKYNGLNFLHYINQKRIQLSAWHLTNSNYSIKEISEIVGYSNDVTFRRLFKKHYAQTPNQYRNTKKQNLS